jgi:predicted ferric reductase
MNNPGQREEREVVSLQGFLMMVLAVIAGAMLAISALPSLASGILSSLVGQTPKAFWYLSRSSAFVAYVMLWLSMGFGLVITNRMAQVWPGGPAAYDLHQHVSLLAIVFSLFHGLILLGDGFIRPAVANVLVPFDLSSYRPFWVGVGQIGFYIFLLVTLTFYARKRLGGTRWRTIHMLSYGAFLLALAHGVMSGTDSVSSWAAWLYFVSAVSVLFLTVYRILAARMKRPRSRPAATSAHHKARRRLPEGG